MTDAAPRPWGRLSGSTLKLFAVIVMLIDHIGLHVIAHLPVGSILLFSIGSYQFTVVEAFRFVGRSAFPIFCFLIAEGAAHTHSRLKYGINLFLFALISEIPWNLIHTGNLQYEKQNVFFTLFMGYLCICLYERLRAEPWLCVILLGIMALYADVWLKADYGVIGMGAVFLFYLLRTRPIALGVLGTCFLSAKWKAFPAYLLIGLYNGERGFIRGKFVKYLFYAFYPVHILLLWYVKYHVLHAS